MSVTCNDLDMFSKALILQDKIFDFLIFDPDSSEKARLLRDKMQMNDVDMIPVHDVSSWCDAF